MTPVLVKYDDLEALLTSAFRIKKKGPLTGPMPMKEPIIQKTGTLKTKWERLPFEEYIECLQATQDLGLHEPRKQSCHSILDESKGYDGGRSRIHGSRTGTSPGKEVFQLRQGRNESQRIRGGCPSCLSPGKVNIKGEACK